MYITVHMDGCPVSRVLVDNGTALNVMPITMLMVLGKTEEFYQKWLYVRFRRNKRRKSVKTIQHLIYVIVIRCRRLEASGL